MIYFPDKNGKSVAAKKFYFPNNEGKSTAVKKLYIGDENGKSKLIYNRSLLSPIVTYNVITNEEFYPDASGLGPDLDCTYGIKIEIVSFSYLENGLADSIFYDSAEGDYKLYKKDSNGEFTNELGSLPYIIAFDENSVPHTTISEGNIADAIIDLSDYQVIGKSSGCDDVYGFWLDEQRIIWRPAAPEGTVEKFYTDDGYKNYLTVTKSTADITEICSSDNYSWRQADVLLWASDYAAYARCYYIITMVDDTEVIVKGNVASFVSVV